MLDRAFVFMGHARDHIGRIQILNQRRFRIAFPGDELSVRSALNALNGALGTMSLGPQVLGAAEIVLAEVLNNIVEHAYTDHGRGVVEVIVDCLPEGLAFRVLDDGRPMPSGKLPEGRGPDLDVSPDQMPEGGFGWLMIRELTDELVYERSANRNILSFRLPFCADLRPN